MRHRVDKKNFGRRQGARKALMRNLVEALVNEERIKTTLPKAKELRRYVEKAITRGKEGSVHARRLILRDYPNKNVMEKIVDDLSVRFKERPGGYTRIRKVGLRPGDQAEVALIEFVDYKPPVKDEKWVEENKKKTQEQLNVASKRTARLRTRKRKIQSKSRIRNRA